jgi:hypothetical protein
MTDNFKWNFTSNQFSIPVALGLLLSALVLRVGYLLHKGIIVTSDTSDYVGVCDLWMTDPLSIVSAHVGLEYVGFTLPFCTVYTLSGGSNMAWVVIQVFVSTLTSVVVYDAGRQYYGQFAGAVAGGVMVVLFDSFRYSVYMLSETTFVFTVAIAIWGLVRHHQLDTAQSRALALGLAGWMAVTRPFGIPILGLWLLLDLLPRSAPLRPNLIARRWIVALGLVLSGVGLGLSSRGEWIESSLYTVWREGWVFFLGDQRAPISLPDLSYDPVAADSVVVFALRNADHLIALGIVKILVFFLPLLPNLGSNTTHQLNALVYTPVAVTSFLGIGLLVRRRDPLLTYTVVPLVAILSVIAVTFVTPYFRYRAPVAPLFALLTGYIASHDTVTNTRQRIHEQI